MDKINPGTALGRIIDERSGATGRWYYRRSAAMRTLI